MKKIVQLREKSNEQLNNRLNEIRTIFHRVLAKNSMSKELSGKNGKGYNSALIGNLKTEKARILTILNERRIKK